MSSSYNSFQLLVLLLKGVANILQKDQAQDDVLVLSRINILLENVSGEPEGLLEGLMLVLFW